MNFSKILVTRPKIFPIKICRFSIQSPINQRKNFSDNYVIQNNDNQKAFEVKEYRFKTAILAFSDHFHCPEVSFRYKQKVDKICEKLLVFRKLDNEIVQNWTQLVENSEIHELNYLIKQLKSLNFHKKLVKVLDNRCLDLMSKMDTANGISLCHAWFDTGISIFPPFSKFNWSKIVTFPQKYASFCLTNENMLEDLGPKEFLLLMQISSMYRRLPGSRKLPNSDRSSLLPILEDKCYQILPKLDYVEIGLLANTIYLSNVELNVQNRKLHGLFYSKLASMPTDLIGKVFC